MDKLSLCGNCAFLFPSFETIAMKDFMGSIIRLMETKIHFSVSVQAGLCIIYAETLFSTPQNNTQRAIMMHIKIEIGLTIKFFKNVLIKRISGNNTNRI